MKTTKNYRNLRKGATELSERAINSKSGLHQHVFFEKNVGKVLYFCRKSKAIVILKSCQKWYIFWGIHRRFSDEGHDSVEP